MNQIKNAEVMIIMATSKSSTSMRSTSKKKRIDDYTRRRPSYDADRGIFMNDDVVQSSLLEPSFPALESPSLFHSCVAVAGN